MNNYLIVGVDISKATLDVCIKPVGLQFTMENNNKGFRIFSKKLQPHVQPGDEVLVVMEHTGYYSFRFEQFLRKRQIGYCKVAALEIIRSSGIKRQKSDKADAQQIAEYGWRRKGELQGDEQLCETLAQLRPLLSFRFQLVKHRQGYKCSLKELKATGAIESTCYLAKSYQHMIRTLSAQIREVEEQIKACIQASGDLLKNYELLLSIKGIGPVTAAYVLLRTENFRRFKEARQFYCYAGLAPFKHQSGTSIKGRDRISNLANKKCKELLSQAANAAVRHDPQLKHYYQQRLKKGKTKRNALNIVRAKLVARMFAVIHRQTPYQLLPAAA